MAQSKIKIADYAPAAGVDKAYVIKTSDSFSSGVVTKYAKKYIETSKSANREVIKRIASGAEELVYTVRFNIHKKAGENAVVTYLFIGEDGANIIESIQEYTTYDEFASDLEYIDAQLKVLFK